MSGPRVLALGIDAAEPQLVRQLLEQGRLPAIAHLLREGQWARVESGASIGSGTVWPSFLTGLEPSAHGVYSEWSWDPAAMALHRTRPRDLRPFWQALAEEGVSVGAIDVPFAAFGGAPGGFELSEWGAHDAIEGRTAVSTGLAPLPQHPFSTEKGRRFDDGVVARCVEGVTMRGEVARRLHAERRVDLSVIVFPELHHLAHHLWQPLVDGVPEGLAAVMVEIDRQVGLLLEASPESSVLLFSLHGMRAARGLSTFLTRFLLDQGFARLSNWSSQSWRERTASLFSAAKRKAPTPLKDLYYRVTPASATHTLARTTMLPPYDWTHTAAFALPTDQHGWIRLNLAGRESAGSVPPARYDALLAEIEMRLREVRSAEGAPLVSDVIISPRASPLPDLIIHWTSAAEVPPFGGQPPGGVQSGQHASDGFVIARGIELEGDAVRASALHRLLIGALRSGSPVSPRDGSPL